MTLLEKATRYAEHMAKAAASGFAVRPFEDVQKIVDICDACDQYDGYACKICGCRCNRSRNLFLNKIASAVSECPLGKW